MDDTTPPIPPASEITFSSLRALSGQLKNVSKVPMIQ
ncbi:unnamed protein product, partial [Rotaria sp. Silwood2]